MVARVKALFDRVLCVLFGTPDNSLDYIDRAARWNDREDEYRGADYD